MKRTGGDAGLSKERAAAMMAAVQLRATTPVSHNLNGQRLGRKGRDTRDRILAAAAEIIEEGEEIPLSLSSVARRASLGMTSLYNYFADITELVLALLEPVVVTAEDAFVGMLRERWPDEELPERCERFVRAYHDFWVRHARLLHMRNSMAAARDSRMMLHRVAVTQPVIALLVQQMDGDPAVPDSPATAMGSVLMTGIERAATMRTDAYLAELYDDAPRRLSAPYLRAATRLMQITIADMRATMAGEGRLDG